MLHGARLPPMPTQNRHERQADSVCGQPPLQRRAGSFQVDCKGAMRPVRSACTTRESHGRRFAPDPGHSGTTLRRTRSALAGADVGRDDRMGRQRLRAMPCDGTSPASCTQPDQRPREKAREWREWREWRGPAGAAIRGTRARCANGIGTARPREPQRAVASRHGMNNGRELPRCRQGRFIPRSFAQPCLLPGDHADASRLVESPRLERRP